MRFILVIFFLVFSGFVCAKEMQAVQIYTDNELLELIKENKHLSRVVLDKCQLVQDIEARASKAAGGAVTPVVFKMALFGVF